MPEEIPDEIGAPAIGDPAGAGNGEVVGDGAVGAGLVLIGVGATGAVASGVVAIGVVAIGVVAIGVDVVVGAAPGGLVAGDVAIGNGVRTGVCDGATAIGVFVVVGAVGLVVGTPASRGATLGVTQPGGLILLSALPMTKVPDPFADTPGTRILGGRTVAGYVAVTRPVLPTAAP